MKSVQAQPEGRIRQFACECCSRLIPLFADLSLEELLLFGERRSAGQMDREAIVSLRSSFSRMYDSLYCGYGDPSPKVLALSAVGEVAFTDSTLDAAINAAEFSAKAIAKKNANDLDDDEYDSVFNAIYTSERAWQAESLGAICPDSKTLSELVRCLSSRLRQ